MLRKLVAIATVLLVLAACTQPPPQLSITSNSPADEATSVPVDVTPTATFNHAVTAESIEEAFSLSVEGGAEVPGEVTLNSNGRIATFTPDQPLAFDTTYVATVSTAVRSSAASNMAAARTWSFTTIEEGDLTVEGVTIVGGDRTLSVGATLQLEAEVDYGEGPAGTSAVTWSSADETVATVSETGELEAIAVGTTTITATSVEDTEQSGSITVMVSEAGEVTSVTIEGDEVRYLADGSVEQLTAIVEAGDDESNAVTWTSSDPDVVAVSDSGEVTVLAPADDPSVPVTVTATSDLDPNQSDSIEIYALDELLSVDYASYAGAADVSEEISIAPTVAGGVGDLTYSLASGAFPGTFTAPDAEDNPVEYLVTLDPDTGIISGSTGFPGVYTGTVTVEDGIGQTTTATFELDLELVFWYTAEDLESLATQFAYDAFADDPDLDVVINGDRVNVSGVQSAGSLPEAFHDVLEFSLTLVAAYDALGAEVDTAEDPFDVNVMDGTVFMETDPADASGVTAWHYLVTLNYAPVEGEVAETATYDIVLYEEGTTPPALDL